MAAVYRRLRDLAIVEAAPVCSGMPVRLVGPLAFMACMSFLSATDAGAESWCAEAPDPVFTTAESVAVGSDWFAVHAVAPGVFAITERRQYEGVTSFLVVGSGRAVLFDSGLGVALISRVVQRMTALPVTVINSHTHFDHVGGNREFTDVRNLDEAYSHASARGEIGESLREYASQTLAEDRVCGALPAGVASRDYEIPAWRIAAHVQDGEMIELGDRRLEVLRTPGHTPDSLSLLDRENGLLFTGDTYYSGEIYLWAPETDLATYTASIDRLAGLAPALRKLLPAHGPPAAKPERLLELQRALREIRSGAARFEPADEGRRLFRFDHFSILMGGAG
jgi:glyoxylase-like metal-dependent hydrolase (beta-lactamase superfamily II)